MNLTEQFSEGSSILHRAPAEGKLLLAAAFACAVAVQTHFQGFALALPLAVGLCLLSRLPYRPLLRRLLLVNSFTALLWILLPLTYGGRTVPLQLGGLAVPVSQDGLYFAGLVTLKCSTILLAILALVATSPISVLGAGLLRLRVPPKLCHLLLFTYRYIHIIGEEFTRLSTAARMRGFRPGTNIHTYRTYANFTAQLLLRSWERAERVQQAMLLRGFNGSFPSLHSPTKSRSLVPVSAVTFTACIALFWIEWTYL